MRPLWIVAIIVVGVFALATVASANLRDEVSSAAAATAGLIVSAGDEASPSPEPSESATPEPDESAAPVPDESAAPEPDATADEVGDDAGEQADNHGAAVSAVAQDKGAVGTKTLANGKTITNHGQAVSTVARSDAGKPDKGGNGED